MIAVDIYFDPNYGKLYEEAEGGRQEIWEFSCEYGCVRHQFIKRPIGDGVWFDLITPYGYGGPIITRLNPGCTNDQLVKAFGAAFLAYCQRNKIVSEFVRFHPLFDNGTVFSPVYQSENIRHTVGTNLKAYSDPVAGEFSKSCRKNIRQALNKGVTYTITEAPESLDRFIDIYYATMDRNAAGEYYYFDKVYFQNCLSFFKEHLLLIEAEYEGTAIAAGIYFAYGKSVHVHLSGTRSEYLHLSPAYILRYAVTLWAKEHGYEMIHHGGGRSNSEEDPLYRFKKQFGQNTCFDFYIGKKIWNEEVYALLCQQNNVAADSAFFPAYRSK